MDTSEVIQRLKSAKRSEVAKATGLKYMYLSRLVWGKMKSPGSDKIDALRRYFQQTDTQ